MDIRSLYLTPERLKVILDYLQKGTISSKQAKEIFFKVLEEQKEPSTYISVENAQISDEKQIEEIIDTILDSHKEQIEEYHNGRTNIFDFFVGQVMKETRGKANPNITRDLLRKKLDK